MQIIRLEIEGMHCDGCAARIKNVLEREPGVREVEVSFAEGQARVRFNEHAASVGRLAEAVEHAGFEVKGRS